MKMLITLILTALLTPMAFADAISDNLMAQILQTDLLEDFWAGDDGADCFEPTVEITSIDQDQSIAHINVHQNGSAVGCYEVSWKCEVAFKEEGGHVELVSKSSNLNCQSL